MEPDDPIDLHILPFSSAMGRPPLSHGTFTTFVEDEEWEHDHLASFDEDDPARQNTEVDLKEALLAGRVVRGLAGTDRNSVLRELVEVLPLPDGVSRDDIFRMLAGNKERDTLVVGDGIALPHPDVPLLIPNARPSVTIGFLDRPVAFGAGGQPVHTIIAIIAPHATAHQNLLDRLTFALEAPDE